MATSLQSVAASATLPVPENNDKPTQDDWTDLADPVERRRRQNRINQRAHRMRLRQRMRNNKDIHPKSVVASASASKSKSIPSSSSSIPSSVSSASSSSSSSSPPPSSAIVRRTTASSPSSQSQACDRCLSPETLRTLLKQFAESAFQSYMLGSPTSDHLLTLTKANVFRALCQNLKLLGWNMDDMDDDSISPFSLPSAAEVSRSTDYSYMPVSLRPTRLQRTVPHHPWLDFFPLPKMRDNVIQAGDDWDDHDLCQDIMGFWNTPSTAAPGLIVWGDPWDIRNWELTETFLKKWQWVVRGCPEIMEATNSWRRARGEKLIFRYI